MMAFAADKCGAKITTIEKDRAAAYAAQENFKKYKVDHIISLINEDVFSILPKLKQEYDLLFLDLYNGLYPEVLDGCIDALKIGGMLIADDTLFPITQKKVFFENSNKKIEEFNKVLSKRNDMNSFLLPLDDGITIAIKQ
ncbi:O-methyltransferase [Dorea longicatena]|nr:class I SAM-dependent methyltransferase [Dorea longicatena]UOX53484.1 class I SAM-dependent methyltransferase [Dorea longicatena]